MVIPNLSHPPERHKKYFSDPVNLLFQDSYSAPSQQEVITEENNLWSYTPPRNGMMKESTSDWPN